MAEQENSLIMEYSVMGFNRYQANGKEGFFLHINEDYPESSAPNSVGSFQTTIRAPYAESSKVIGVKMSRLAPALVKLKCRLTSFQGATSLVCEEILSISPFKAVSSAIPK